ncbi:MAG: HEAT repeat domain-containing protein [Planctomycetes bacterium]|nr:HEAT repeat domain-containing protein [Planctomycetota bacterium]
MTPCRTHRLAALAAILVAAVVPGQEPAPPPLDPALTDQLKELKTLVSDRKMEADFQAIGLIQNLSRDVEKKHPKDQEKLAKGLGDVFRTGKLRPAERDILYREAADALAKLGTVGGKELAKVVEDKRFDDNLPLRGHLLLALGRTQDDKQVELLTDIAVRSPHDELRAAAGEALGSYTKLEIKARREIVKALIREWGAIHQLATQPESNDPNGPIDLAPQNAQRRLRTIEGKWNQTLQKLTGTSNAQFADWQRWLNKNPNWVPPGAGR